MASKGRSRTRRGGVRVADVCEVLEAIAPPALAEDWDNVGLVIGDRSAPARRVLLTVDLTPAVLGEARRLGAEMVMAYHPPIFKAVRRLTPEGAATAYAAARAGLAVYSMHTALDAAEGGTNDVLADAIGLTGTRPLQPAATGAECKVVVFVPPADLARVAAAAFAAGAGRIGKYTECSHRAPGVGTFRGGEGSRPAVGHPGRRREVLELRLEVVAPAETLGGVLGAIRASHSYETPAIDVYRLEPAPASAGMGRIGRLKRPTTVKAFIGRVKRALRVRRLLVAGPRTGRVATAACCAGSCGGLFEPAAAGGADAYVTGEMRHHDALAAAAGGMTVLCAGHANSERITLPRVAEKIRAALPAVEVRVARTDRDPLEIA